ncbi:MAG: 3'-5' exonuclease [Armatimonadota bacterium]|nr:3'-5' exonuclease [Armatimonadota bacterium]MDR5698144.1 3'-5' exonuclease [Armatimonadota bacterium]
MGFRRAEGVRSPWHEAVYWCLDLETSDLDAARAEVLSVGVVPVHGGVVCCADLYRSFVRLERETARWRGSRAHHIVPADLTDAPAWPEVVREVDRRLRGGVLVVHGASVDVPFLRRGYERAGISWPPGPVVDTVRLLQRLDGRLRWLFGRSGTVPVELGRARARVGLPRYPRHDAATDAVATAELFLVLVNRLGVRSVGDVVRWGA